MHNLENVAAFKTSIRLLTIHCLHDFPHKQDSQLNSLVLITVWRVVIEVWQDSQLNSSAFSHCSVWRVAIGKGVYPVISNKGTQFIYSIYLRMDVLLTNLIVSTCSSNYREWTICISPLSDWSYRNNK